MVNAGTSLSVHYIHILASNEQYKSQMFIIYAISFHIDNIVHICKGFCSRIIDLHRHGMQCTTKNQNPKDFFVLQQNATDSSWPKEGSVSRHHLIIIIIKDSSYKGHLLRSFLESTYISNRTRAAVLHQKVSAREGSPLPLDIILLIFFICQCFIPLLSQRVILNISQV